MGVFDATAQCAEVQNRYSYLQGALVSSSQERGEEYFENGALVMPRNVWPYQSVVVAHDPVENQ